MHIAIRATLASLLLFSCTHILLCDVDLKESILGVVIMVKDEADVIIPTLEPFVKAGIDTFVVYDTGSSDKTPDIVRTYFQEQHIEHFYIVEEPFVDFATSRNRLLNLAEEHFPNVTFFIMLDAEWYTHNVEGLLEFCRNHAHEHGCFALKLLTVQDNIGNYVVRLMKNKCGARYEGVVHETIKGTPSGSVPDSVYFEYAPQETGREKSRTRCLRDYALLKKHIDENPTDTRTMFYLAQTCQFLDKWEEAIAYYKKRAEVNDISEECYLAYYRIGCAIEYILYNENAERSVETYTWDDVLRYYLAAYNMLPHRAEPLVRIATYYLYYKNYGLAYLFASHAAELPYPECDVLFVEKNVYDFVRYDILGQCALYVGKYKEGMNATLKAIKSNPDALYLYHNLAVYLQNNPL